MNARGMVRRAGLTLGVCLLAVSAHAQATATQKPAQQPFEPKVGQAGKDVVWVPTSQALVDKMLDMAKVTPQDFVMDLGFGRRPHRHHRRQARRDRHGHRVQPRHGRAVEGERREGGRHRQGDVPQGRPLRDRLLEGDGHHDVPAARDQRQAAPEDPEPQAGHARGLELLHDGGLGSGPDRDHQRRAARAGARRCSGSSRPRSTARGRHHRAISRSRRPTRRSPGRSARPRSKAS